MKSYIKQNPIKTVTFTVSSFGLLITFAYFWHIGFLPEMTIDQLAPVFIGNALVSGLIFVFLISIFTYSGLVWPTDNTTSSMASLWSEGNLVSRKKLLLWYGIPVLPLPLALILFFISKWQTVVLLMGFMLYLYYLYIKHFLPSKSENKIFFEYLALLLFTSLLYICVFSFIYLFIDKSGTDNTIDKLASLFSGAAIVWFGNILAIGNPINRSKTVWWLIVGVVTVILFIIFTRTWHAVPYASMRAQGIGQVKDFVVSTKDELCLSLPKDIISHTQELPKTQTTLCTLKPLLLLSTLGKNLTLEYTLTEQNNNSKTYRFTIPKESVTASWIKM
ncbi:MAG: hypothetical protein ABW176_14905 [Candidatus Thiodiazotropha endolucinida]